MRRSSTILTIFLYSQTNTVLISGTGMIAYGWSEDGSSTRCGGWGCLTDPGSGYWFGIQTLKAMWGSFDGTQPKTTLHTDKVVTNFCGVSKTEDIIGWTYSDSSFQHAASLCVLAFQEAEKGDEVCKKLLDEGARHLATHVSTVAKKLNLNKPFSVVLSGSVATSPLMQERLKNILQTETPLASLTLPIVAPSEGAAQLCLKKATSSSSS